MKPKQLKWEVIDSVWEKAIGLEDGYFLAGETGHPVRLYYPWDVEGNYGKEFPSREAARAEAQRHYGENIREIIRTHMDLSEEESLAARKTVPVEDDLYDRVGGNVDDAYGLGYDDGHTTAARILLEELQCTS